MRPGTGLALAAVGLGTAASLHACGEALSSPSGTAESARYVVVWQTRPAPVVVGEHFIIDLIVCPKAGAPAPSRIRVDAQMPAHRHGMNYRPSVASTGGARYRVEGMLFHMPGYWRLDFEVGDDASLDSIRADMRL